MKGRNRWMAAARWSAALSLLLVFAAGLPARGQETEEDAIKEDEGSAVDPGFDDSANTLGLLEEVFDGDGELLDFPGLYAPEVLGVEPSEAGFPESLNRGGTYDGMSCAAPPANVLPIGLGSNPQNPNGAAKRYLSYAGAPRVLVGASADSVCHWQYPAPVPPATIDICHDDNYQLLLCKMHGGAGACDYADPGHPNPRPSPGAPKLNKIRLWVAVAGEKSPANVPFARFTVFEKTQSFDVWRLDLKNEAYFNRLRKVVAMARELGIFVEVTFFAPFEGDYFAKGPWYYNTPTASAPHPNAMAMIGGVLTQVGFREPTATVNPGVAQKFFVTADSSPNSVNERMRTYQKKVIDWTLDTLWCFDNVLWEIANEPEGRTVLPLAVAAWQKSMIQHVASRDKGTVYPGLGRPHLIAVQPFTVEGFNDLRAFLNPQAKRYVSLFNGHYTQVLTPPVGSPARSLDLGAIQLARRSFNLPLALGFNETKITPFGGKAGVAAHVNSFTTISSGISDPSRAEGWEFLFGQGAVYDHWSYLTEGAVSGTTAKIQAELGRMKSFVDTLPLDRLKPSDGAWVVGAFVPSSSCPTCGSWSLPSGSAKPSGLPKYPEGMADWEPVTRSQRYWSSLADAATAGQRTFLLYTHHSTRRCEKGGSFTSAGCGTDAYLSLGGYDARIWSVNPPNGSRYQDKLRIHLGSTAGTFKVEWFNPESVNAASPLAGETIVWSPAGGGSCGSLANCRVCNNPASCQITSPFYSYDSLLRITQQ